MSCRHANTWEDLLTAWGSIMQPTRKCLALLTAQVFAYHIWRERNARSHDRSCFGPRKLLADIVLDIKVRLASSSWFRKYACIELDSWLIM